MQRNAWRRSTFLSAMAMAGFDFKRSYDTALRIEALSAEELAALQLRRFRSVAAIATLNDAFCDLNGIPHRRKNFDLGDARPIAKSEMARIAECVRRVNNCVVKRSSGSSGPPIAIPKSKAGVAKELAATWRSYRWYGIEPGARVVRVWGRPLRPRARIVRHLKDALLNAKSLSAFDVTEETLARRVRRIASARPALLYGYTSALYILAEYMTRNELPRPESLSAVVSTAEPLDSEMRHVITQAFGVACKDEYGCSEVGSIAHECAYGQMHIMADNLIVEVLNAKGEIAREGSGELLLTDLTNDLTPVVRYRCGDFGEIMERHACNCGSQFPILRELLGRVEDTVVMRDGTRHHPASVCYLVDRVNEYFNVVKQYQVVQRTFDEFKIRVVPKAPFSPVEFSDYASRVFSSRFRAEIRVDVEVTPEIARESSGKFRIVVSHVNPS